jgi:Uma2 family endonuclease
MATAQSPAEQRFRLSNIPWDTYVTFSDELGPRHVRVTYDRGEMEFMTLSPEHEHRKSILARLVEALTEELDIDIASFGSMTCRREDMARGLEGDECYWIANEPKVRGRMDIDLEVDPPPDLALEIDVSHSSLNRMEIYAALRVPEVWKWDGVTLTVFWLTDQGTYRQNARSRAFPAVPMEEFAAFLSRTDISETKLVRLFRAWVRERLGGGQP